VVVGSGINSLLFCYRTEIPLLIEKIREPFYFDETQGDFSFLGLETKNVRTAELWNRAYVLLGMAGLILNPLPMQSIRIEDDLITYITPKNKKVVIQTNEIIFFEKERKQYMVYDWFDVKSGGKHNIEKLKDPENFFVQFLRFHSSLRKNVRGVKDVVAISRLSESQIIDLDYTEGLARLKTLSMMKGGNIKGAKGGLDRYGKQRYSPLKIEHSHREVIPKIQHHMSLKKILAAEQTKGKLWNLTKNLFIRTTPFI
tara:strand:+ start:1526 stop:2293 length:768 start_codon:yes stop_codon:yes gene_type:complete